MGAYKRYLERQMDEGWTSVGGAVCAECFSDYAIKDFIESSKTELKCAYCSRTSKEPIAADMDEVLSFISHGFRREYDIPENCLSWDSGEGGWQLVTPDDAYDLIPDLDICTEGGGQLQDDLVRAFSDRQFVRRDPLGIPREDGFRYSWESFCDHTKHKTRFVFFKERRPRPRKYEMEEWEGQSIPYHILLDLGSMVDANRLVKSLPKGTNIVRARQHSPADRYSISKDLGPPPKEKASQSRLSPAGIAMFYGAKDEQTAFAETFDPAVTAKNVITFATFRTTRPLLMLDLTNIPDIPSIFDEVRYNERPPLIFLHHFQSEVSKPIARDGRIHYEYVPTQIVAEYFRHICRERRHRIDGIIYNSSLNQTGVCYCMFGTADSCTDGPKPTKQHMLVLTGSKRATIDSANNSFHICDAD